MNELRERRLNPPEWLDPPTARIDAANDFGDVPDFGEPGQAADARPLNRHSAMLLAAQYPGQLVGHWTSRGWQEIKS